MFAEKVEKPEAFLTIHLRVINSLICAKEPGDRPR
jgi:hypothetical protein